MKKLDFCQFMSLQNEQTQGFHYTWFVGNELPVLVKYCFYTIIDWVQFFKPQGET